MSVSGLIMACRQKKEKRDLEREGERVAKAEEAGANDSAVRD